MKKTRNLIIDLQHFAEVAEGASNQASGENSFADAEQKNELLLKENSKEISKGENTEKINKNENPEIIENEFEELINGKFKEQFRKKTQNIIDKRFKETKILEEFKNNTSPILQILNEKYKINEGDFNGLKKAIFSDKNISEENFFETEDFENNDYNYENRKSKYSGLENISNKNENIENNISENDNIENNNYEIKNSEINNSKNQINFLKSKVISWVKESDELKNIYPDFNFRNELKNNSLFKRLLYNGVSLKDTYEVVHKDEILSGAMAYTAQKVREQVVKGIEAKGRRPLENGISSGSGIVTMTDVNALTSKDILKILKQVENGKNIKF